MINRVLLVVLDGLGIGPLPDASAYGDSDCNTLAHLCDAANGVQLPNLEKLGLGHLGEFTGIRGIAQPDGCFGRLGFLSKGKDSLTGHWELACCPLEDASGIQGGFTPRLSDLIEEAIGQKTLGNRTGVAYDVVEDSRNAHQQSGSPIAWLDDVGTIHLAASEALVPADDLYRMCREVRRVVKADHPVVRVVAHPFSNQVGRVSCGDRRRHFATEPTGPTLLDQLSRASQLMIGLGKVSDLFSGRGVTRSSPASGYRDALEELLGQFGRVPRGLLFANLEFLSSNLDESVEGLQYFDRLLPDLQARLKQGDVLIITADHGRDASRTSREHSREYVPLLITGPKLPRGVNLGTRNSAADLGQTIGEALGASRLPAGDSFLDSLRAG